MPRTASGHQRRAAGRYGGKTILRARHRALAVAVFLSALVAAAAGLDADAHRTISLYNIHTKETLTSVYKRNGKYVAAEMAKINWIMRDWRKDEATTMDPELIDLLWEIHSELHSAEPIHVISGYRSRSTNDMLRRTVGGQASQSRHILGKAADVHFPDVPVRNLRYSALIREKGGVGYYPTSAIPFVHVDTDRVRAWPRLPRAELALLFPSGHTRHLPADGEPITKADVREARAKHKDLAVQLAAFHDLRMRPHKLPIQTASLDPALPRLLRPPRLVERRSAFGTLVTEEERAKLAALAGRPPRLLALPAPAVRGGRTGGARLAAYDPAADPARAPYYREPHVVAAPAYDEEHPEELFYRPFPIAPFLTTTASADDPALAGMLHPDLVRVLEMMDQENAAPPMRLRPGAHAARLLWAQEFRGEAVNFAALQDAGPPAFPGVSRRKVATQPQ
jgi:uncharacterized protein YcbK (DUF882 family)